ncbi:MAG: hypothetical protein IJP48_00555 [Synergistaceae bacterium]|nr:hypothetical protein [Synergistaceae bacterium]
MLNRCPRATLEEQKRNIFVRCHEYREVSFPEPNQIIRIGDKPLAEWTYQSVLTGLALSRWQDTQEFICRHFKDWGAMDDPHAGTLPFQAEQQALEDTQKQLDLYIL